DVREKLVEAGFRVALDERDEKIGYKIREAQMQKVPYMLVLGDKEIESGEVNVRKYGEKQSESMQFEDFIKIVSAEVSK
ncbi:threonine--tRNA ligase, partial [Microvirga sp. 3-52]|nr:threonine--tRNA ligase [Microvirga sp. 3-52]